MVFDLYSKRAKAQRGETIDVYTYDALPSPLKVQITYIFDYLFKIPALSRHEDSIYKAISQILREERGVYQLHDAREHNIYESTWNYEKEVKNYFLKEENSEHAIDVIEIIFRICSNTLIKNHGSAYDEEYNEICEKLNTRFKEHGIGYAIEDSSIIRIDSEIAHKTIIQPTLSLLHNKNYQNAEHEYLAAHEHYRHSRYSECLVDCLKALETTIRIIAHENKWQNVQDKDTASKLIEHVFTNQLIPTYLTTHFSSLRSCLESGIPTVRNKEGGHGRGIKTTTATAYMAEYLLGTTASTIRLLVEANEAQKP